MGGAGCVIGPIIGSGCYYILGFSGTFYLLGVIMMLFAIVCSITQKSSKNSDLNEPLIERNVNVTEANVTIR